MLSLGVTVENYFRVYDQRSGDLTKLLMVLLVPLSSTVLAHLNRGRKTFFADHLTASFELFAFILILCDPLVLTGPDGDRGDRRPRGMRPEDR